MFNQLNIFLIFLCFSSYAFSEGFGDDFETTQKKYKEEIKIRAEELVGKEFWIYTKRESCEFNVNLRKQPNHYSTKYLSDEPAHIKITDHKCLDDTTLKCFFKATINDKDTGYFQNKNFHINNGEEYLDYSGMRFKNGVANLRSDCLFSISPDQIKEKISFYEEQEKQNKLAKQEEEKIKQEKTLAAEAENKRIAELEMQAQEKAKNIGLQERVPEILSGMRNDEFCVTYGKYAANLKIPELGSPTFDLSALMKKEVVKRKLKINPKYAKADYFWKGMNECELYANVGMPKAINRSIGSWGVHIQYVYNFFGSLKDTYVYTENGRVIGWQD